MTCTAPVALFHALQHFLRALLDGAGTNKQECTWQRMHCQGRTLFSQRSCCLARTQVFRVVKVDRVLTWRFWAVRILPVGFFMALTLHFGNVVYLYLTVAFIQMLKVLAAQAPGSASCPCWNHIPAGDGSIRVPWHP